MPTIYSLDPLCVCVQVRFMLETMMALKNNDMRKIPGYDPEPLEKTKKLHRTLVGSAYMEGSRQREALW